MSNEKFVMRRKFIKQVLIMQLFQLFLQTEEGLLLGDKVKFERWIIFSDWYF